MALSLKKILFRLPPDEITCAKRGFGACEAGVQEKLEKVGQVFVEGYRLALETSDEVRLAATLEQTFDAHHVGFAFEGAGFYYALLDVLIPRRQSRLRAFTDDLARKHNYLATVGAGFALARVPWGRRYLPGYLRKLDPMLAWCVPDGYGFHQGFFHPQRFIERCEAPPSGWPAYARRLFDAGIGRSLWWVEGADPKRIRQAVEQFPEARRAELWCGVGLACAYAGGVGEDVAKALVAAAGCHRADVLSGASFAANMRRQGNNPSPWTERICQLFLGMTAYQASDWIETEQDIVLAGLPRDDAERGGRCYLAVRRRLVASLADESWVMSHGA